MARKKENNSQDNRQEILGILIMAFAVLVFLGLVSHHQSDYPNSGSYKHVQNWLGLAGAWISYYLYVYTIGYACLLFPVLIFMFGGNLFLQKPLKPYFRISGYVLALGVFFSTALALPEAVSEEGSKFGFQLSGLMGGFIAEQLFRYLGKAGSIVVLLTFMLLFLVSATSWSMRDALLAFKAEINQLRDNIARKWQERERKPKKTKPATVQKPSVSHSAQPSQNRVPVIEHVPQQAPPQTNPRSFPQAPVAAAGTQPQVQKPVEQVAQGIRPVSDSSQSPTVPPVTGEYVLPPVSLLSPPPMNADAVDDEDLRQTGQFIEEKLREFGVEGTVVNIQTGPVITRFEIEPAPGVKISRFVNCQEDLALVLRSQRVRVVAPIPGKAAVGIEVPNPSPSIVAMTDVIQSKNFQTSKSKLTLALGKTIDGLPYSADLADMPHLLVAGSTGSGKSVCLNTLITSILYNASPSDVKFVMIDPKKLELNLYQQLLNHHLTTREGLDEIVVTTVDNAISVLKSLEMEMERRYRMLARCGVRNIADYNEGLKKGSIPGGGEGPFKKLPYVVLIVDELADLMVTGAREIEEPIARLAQMSRAVGIHLILATQRPSVDVITGVIKANFPSRIAFQVAQKNDSRTILDRNGAEKLLGKGDMLFLHPREPEPIRIHGAFISAEEVKRVVNYIRKQPQDGELYRLPGYSGTDALSGRRGGGNGGRSDRDELFLEAAKLIIRHQQGSASLLQRRLRVGYARAGRIIDELEDAGIIGPYDGSKAREVLVDESYIEELENPKDEFEEEFGI